MSNSHLPVSCIRQCQSYPPAWPGDVGWLSCSSVGHCTAWMERSMLRLGTNMTRAGMAAPAAGSWSFSVCSKLLFGLALCLWCTMGFQGAPSVLVVATHETLGTLSSPGVSRLMCHWVSKALSCSLTARYVSETGWRHPWPLEVVGSTGKGLQGSLFCHQQIPLCNGAGCHWKVLISGRGTFRQSSYSRGIGHLQVEYLVL